MQWHSMLWFSTSLLLEKVIFSYFKFVNKSCFSLNSLSANPTKWSNTIKQFVGKLQTNCLSLFDHFVGLALKGLILMLIFAREWIIFWRFNVFISSSNSELSFSAPFSAISIPCSMSNFSLYLIDLFTAALNSFSCNFCFSWSALTVSAPSIVYWRTYFFRLKYKSSPFATSNFLKGDFITRASLFS